MQFIEILKTIVLGIIQGITEWLPISSTGHMILADTFLQLNQPKDFMDMFFVVIQLVSILAVVVLYFNTLNPFAPSKSRAERYSTFQLWAKVLVAVLPVGVIGLLVDDWVTEHFYTPVVIAIALIFYGILFILLERRNRTVKPRIRSFEQLSWRTALCIGFLQLLAIIPGTSRSGSTILGAMLLSCSRFVATEFSFFMAVPVMFGASGYKILKFVLKTGLASITGFQWGLLLKVTQAMRCRCTQQQTARQKVVLNSSLKAGEYLCSLLQGRETEALLLVCLDAGKAVRHCEQLESGVSDSISTTLRQIAQLCVNRNVHDIILAHNHPSGLVHPSREDIVMTRKAQDFLQEIGVNLLDHFVITDKEFYSMKDHRLF